MTTDRRLVLGVDGGNTKTIALAATTDGTVVGAARALGGSDIYAVGVDAAIASIDRLADEALRAARSGPGADPGGGSAAAPATPAAAAFSLAGADWSEDIAVLRERLAARWPEPLVVNDAIGALRAAVPHGPGVVVVCGTGAATGARGADGRTWHSSFWQEPQGAYELGVRALHAVFRAELRIDPPTALRAAVLEALGERDVEAVLHRTTRREGRDRQLAAGLAPVLLDVAEGGDPVAIAIVRAQGVSLGQTALAAARQVGIERLPFALALAGGVLRHAGAALRETIVATVLADAPQASVVRPPVEPAAGALLLAFDRAGVEVTEAVEARLRATLPPADLFDTHPASATERG
jgi:N-acetylglucosamine kinase-like BadF-type ATPase